MSTPAICDKFQVSFLDSEEKMQFDYEHTCIS